MRELTIKVIIAGAVIGALLSVTNVILRLKAGIGFGLMPIAALIGFGLLRIRGKYNPKGNMMLSAIATNAAISMWILSDTVAAVVIFEGSFPSVWMILFLGVAGMFLGTLFALALRKPWLEEERLPFPGGAATGEIIKTLTETGSRRFKLFSISFIAALLFSIPIYQLHLVPSSLPGRFLNVPTFVGIALSPLIFGIGVFVGWKVAFSIMAGSILSTTLWVFAEQAQPISYGSHLMNPEVFSIGVFSMIVFSGFILIRIRKVIGKVFRSISVQDERKTNGSKCPVSSKVFSLGFIILLPLSFLILSQIYAEASPIVFILVFVPFMFLGTVICTRATGETNFAPAGSFGFLAMLVAVLFTRSFMELLFAWGFVGFIAAVTGPMMHEIKANSLVGSSLRELIIAQTIGSIVGVAIGVPLMYVLWTTYGFGTDTLPSPASIVWGTLSQSFSKGTIPPSIDPNIAILTSVTTVILAALKVPVLSVGMGIIIPASYGISIGLSGFVTFVLEKKYEANKATLKTKLGEWQAIATGLIAGEGLSFLVQAIFIVLGF